MTIEIITPSSRDEWLVLRKQTVGASEAACLLGIHPNLTSYTLWAVKTGALQEDPSETPAMRRGRLLEDDALQIVSEERPEWKLSPNTIPGGAFFRDMCARISATPDCFVVEPGREGRAILQVKSVAPTIFKKTWVQENGDVEPPLHVAVQATIEAKLSGCSRAYAVALVINYGADAHVVEIPINDRLWDRIKREVAEFWKLAESGTMPDLDYQRDGSLLAQLYEPTGEIISLESDNSLPVLADEKAALSSDRTAADKRLKEIRTELLAKLGGASAARIADGRLITANRIKRAAYSVEASSYIDIRVKKQGRTS